MTSYFIAVGPLVLGPLSEIYGRSRVLQIANLFFLGKSSNGDSLQVLFLIFKLISLESCLWFRTD